MQIEDVLQIPRVQRLESPSPEEFRFSIPTYDWIEHELTLEIRIPCLRGMLIIPEARVIRVGGGKIPSAFSDGFLEDTLYALIQQEKDGRLLEAKTREEANRNRIFEESKTLLKDRLDTTILDFIQSRQQYQLLEEMIPEFFESCGHSLAAALTKSKKVDVTENNGSSVEPDRES